jgi:hypothetical protein
LCFYRHLAVHGVQPTEVWVCNRRGGLFEVDLVTGQPVYSAADVDPRKIPFIRAALDRCHAEGWTAPAPPPDAASVIRFIFPGTGLSPATRWSRAPPTTASCSPTRPATPARSLTSSIESAITTAVAMFGLADNVEALQFTPRRSAGRRTRLDDTSKPSRRTRLDAGTAG